MSLQFQVETLDNVDEAMRPLYTEQDGKFVLGIEGLPKDNSAEYEERITKMSSKIDELLGEKKEEAKKRRDAEELAKKEAADLAKKNGDTEALEKSWQEKYDSTVSELKSQYEPKVKELEALLDDSTVGATAAQMAAELALVPDDVGVLVPHIRPRLAMAIKNNKAVPVVLGPDGKPSALSLEELKNEFIGNATFARNIAGSKATGGGANGSDGGAGTKTLKRADFSTKSPNEQMEFVKGGGQIID